MSTALRLGTLYAAMFTATGCAIPYLPVLLRELGFTGTQIALVFSAPMLARVVSGPLIAAWADRFQRRRTPAAILLLVAAVAFTAAGITRDFGVMLAAGFVWGTAQPAAVPLTDVMTLRRARREGFDYGWPRGMGSVAYIASNMAWGALLALAGARAVPWFAVACLMAGAAVALWLIPPEPVHDETPPEGAGRFDGVHALLGNRTYVLAISAAGLVTASHAYFYSFSTLLWTGEGVPAWVVGLLWGFGVAVEVLFLWFMRPWRDRLGPERLLLLAAGAGVFRWIATALQPPLWLLFPLQGLHALTFAAAFVAGLQLIERSTPARHASLAQTLSSAWASGLLIGLATLASGPLYDRFGAWGYLMPAGMCLLALGLAWALTRQPQTSAVGGSTTEPT